MGYQQKLLYISSLIVVGTAILVGIQKFKSASRDAAINALILDLMDIATHVQTYYIKPSCLAGGEHSFSGLANDPSLLQQFLNQANSINGSFKIVSISDDILVIQAVGKDDYDDDGQNLTIEMKVFSDKVETAIINY